MYVFGGFPFNSNMVTYHSSQSLRYALSLSLSLVGSIEPKKNVIYMSFDSYLKNQAGEVGRSRSNDILLNRKR